MAKLEIHFAKSISLGEKHPISRGITYPMSLSSGNNRSYYRHDPGIEPRAESQAQEMELKTHSPKKRTHSERITPLKRDVQLQ